MLCIRASYSIVSVGYDTMICDAAEEERRRQLRLAATSSIMCSDSLATAGTVIRSFARR